MQILVVLGHPGRESFNRAIAQRVLATLHDAGHRTIWHDLYAEGFDPALPPAELGKDAPLPEEVEGHCRDLAAADGIIVIHPNWWGQPPAIVKGWIDRTFRQGTAYRYLPGDAGDGVPVGLLRAGTAVVLNTSDTPEARELSVFGDPLETLWRKCIFEFCGVRRFFRRMFGVVVTSAPEQRAVWLAEVEEIIRYYFPKESGAC
ncbi:putative NADPH-quinone reductase [Hydrogenispora ethanolica]|uniref:Putative NADPH-quinone reductase n=1 Tax=Hydrogenispora ethanolica TaxID=1082276 RepID=A0A4R1S4G8_HYDET|nr:NAD(P)H-dependent oxidoreductase [Hydrogenispora ethanolica]TCL73272.1 putative NADPH-quinone reductase [Hydrogenispora ethanolica]